MLLKSFDQARVICVDYRYERELNRVLALLAARGIEAEPFVNGQGSQLPRKCYNQISRPPPETWIEGAGSYNHFRAFKTMITQAKEAGHKSLLIAEDDVILSEDFDAVVAGLQVPEDWDMLYYGANHHESKTKDIGTNLLRCFGSKTTHLVAFRDTIYDAVLSLPSDRSIDWSIGERLHQHFNCYAVYPAVAIQKPGYSVIWQQNTDYTKLFKSKGTFL